ncbi:Hypothetical predicted protein [Xyrichtys novacula]|uniref:Deoxycytidylate deaminase n=1 Tax=Xyrichtys novacula TaxID=13765 RepID=A0AAV1EXX7_XYRNO|nr:Hypothetical predicted protein [Xyrichtys novacula]
MLYTGDVQGCLRKLEPLLRAINYPEGIDYNGLSKGDPSAFLPIISFTLTSFSPSVAEQLMAAGLELTGKTDLRFTDTFYKVLRDIFHYKPVLTKEQFLQWRFSQSKISIVCDVINLVLQRHNQLKKPRIRNPALNTYSREVQPTLAGSHTVSDRLVALNHTENLSALNLDAPHIETLSSCSPGNWVTETTGEGEEEEEEREDLLHSSEFKDRLSALEDQLQSLWSGLDQIRVLEKRLEDLERQRHTDRNQGDVVMVSRESWENLMSRILLLETKEELRDTQSSIPPPCPPSSSSSSSSSSTMSDASKEDLKERLERITNISMTKKREDYLEWPEYFMAVAFLSAQRSKDPSSQVGACIVNQENKIVGIGYNGMPNGCDDDLLPWSRSAENRLDTKYPYVCHAELNAIMNKNSADVKDCTMYVALFPCNECAKLIIQAGLKEVVYLSDKYHHTPEMVASRKLLSMAGIQYRQFVPKRTEIVIDFNSINHPGMLSGVAK